MAETRSEMAPLLPAGAEAPQSCPGGCCHSGAHACCGISLPTTVDLIPPPRGRLRDHRNGPPR
jgi:hypothetical protein